ncbi:F-box protein [Hordeum vulgare]|nr:F-box protein [Hordeum vulgare]
MASSLRVLLHRTQALFRAPSPPVYLPDELLSNILSRLPEGSLCRFRCVSKEWHTLLSDPAFVAAHRSQAKPFVVVASLTHATGLRLG